MNWIATQVEVMEKINRIHRTQFMIQCGTYLSILFLFLGIPFVAYHFPALGMAGWWNIPFFFIAYFSARIFFCCWKNFIDVRCGAALEEFNGKCEFNTTKPESKLQNPVYPYRWGARLIPRVAPRRRSRQCPFLRTKEQRQQEVDHHLQPRPQGSLVNDVCTTGC